MNILEYLNSNSGAIQSVMVVVLSLITAVYAWDTRRLANISTRQLDLLVKPVAVVGESVQIIVKQESPDSEIPASITDFVQFAFKITNIGKVPLRYIGYTSFNESSNIEGHGAILYPGQSFTHRTEVYPIKPISPKMLTGIVGIEIVYNSLDQPEQRYFFSRKFEIGGSWKGYNIIEDNAGTRI